MALSGIEIEIYKDSAPFDKVAVLEARQEPRALREIKGVGAGSFQISKSNKKINDDPTLLDYRNFARVRVNGQCLGGFLITNKKHAIVGEGEKSDEVWSISGEGLRSWANDAGVRSAKGITPYSRETRYFNFASEQGPWYKANEWTSATRTWTWNQPGNWWLTAPSEWPDAPTAQWIWDRAAPYEMPIGDVYFRREFTLAAAGSYALFFAADDRAEVYIDGELIHTTADNHSWQETAREDLQLDAGTHILAFKCRQNNIDTPGSLIAAFYKIGNATSPTAAELLFTTQAGSAWKVCGYPTVAPGWTPGNILLTLLSEAAARGVRFAQNWTPTFTHTHDSAGVAWGDPLSISFDIGTLYEEVFQALEEGACDIYLDADTLELHAYKKRGVDRSLENAAIADPIVLRLGHNLKKADEQGQADIVNTLLLNTADGWKVEQPTDTTSVTRYGVIEGQISTEMSYEQAKGLIQEVFEKKAMPEKTATFELIPVPGMVPFEDFFEGDYVSAPGEVPGIMEKRRIMSISVSENATGNPIYAIEFDAIFSDRTDDLAKMLSKAAHASALGTGFTGASGTPQTDTKGSNPQTPVSAPPQAPTGLLVQTVGRWAENGTAVSDFGLTWSGVVANVNNLPVSDIEKYEVWGRRTADAEYGLLVTVFDTYAYLTGYRPGEEWIFQVRALSRTGGWGDFSDPVVLIADPPLIPLDPPSTPTLSTDVGTVSVRWDGLLGGQPAPRRYKYMEIERSTSINGTYVRVSSFVTSGGVDTSGIVGTTYWYRLVPYDYLNVRGVASVAVSIKVAGVDTSDLDNALNDAIAGAISKADQAITAANGKNKITFSNSEPTTSNVGIAGDLWYQRDGAGKIKGIWENTGTNVWVKRTQSGETLVDVDAATITTGFLGSDRIGANTITSKQILIANLDNQLDNPNFETGTFQGWEQTGSTLGWGVGTSISDNINRYLQRITAATARPAGQVTNGFRVAVRPDQRMRLDFKSHCLGVAPGTWQLIRKNYFADPQGTAQDFFVDTVSGTYENITTMPGGTPTAVRWRRTTTSTGRIAMKVGSSLPNDTIRFRARVRASEAMTATIQVRANVGATTPQVTLVTDLAIPAGVSEIDVSGVVSGFTMTTNAGVVILPTSGSVGSYLDITNVMIERQSISTGGFFHGSMTTDSDLAQYRWLGEPNESQSQYETRSAGATIGAQFYDAAGAPLSYNPKALISTGAWADVTWETPVPVGAYFASLRIEDPGTANTTVRLANLQFRLMGAGQLLVDGIIQGRHVAAKTFTGELFKAGSIEVDVLSPNVGSSLNLNGNTNITALSEAAQAQQDALTSQQQLIDGVSAAAEQAAEIASGASASAAATALLANGLQAGIQTAQGDIDDLGRTYRFTENGAFVGAPGSAYEFVIQNTGAEIRYNGVAVSSWDAGQMIVDSFVGNEVVLGNHKLEKDDLTGGTVVRKIVSN